MFFNDNIAASNWMTQNRLRVVRMTFPPLPPLSDSLVSAMSNTIHNIGREKIVYVLAILVSTLYLHCRLTKERNETKWNETEGKRKRARQWR